MESTKSSGGRSAPLPAARILRCRITGPGRRRGLQGRAPRQLLWAGSNLSANRAPNTQQKAFAAQHGIEHFGVGLTVAQGLPAPVLRPEPGHLLRPGTRFRGARVTRRGGKACVAGGCGRAVGRAPCAACRAAPASPWGRRGAPCSPAGRPCTSGGGHMGNYASASTSQSQRTYHIAGNGVAHPRDLVRVPDAVGVDGGPRALLDLHVVLLVGGRARGRGVTSRAARHGSRAWGKGGGGGAPARTPSCRTPACGGGDQRVF